MSLPAPLQTMAASNEGSANKLDVKQLIACRFGNAAAMYDAHAVVQREIADFAFAQIERSRSDAPMLKSAVDIGCGTGAFTQRLLQFSKNVTGLDLAQGMIRFAQQHYAHKQICWAVSDAEALSLADNSTDLIYSSMALQWLSTAEKVAQECFRIISATGQGTLAVVVDGSLNELNHCWESINQNSPVNRFMPVKSWYSAFKNAGFEVQLQQQRFTSWHANIFAVLHSIKDIGAGVVLDSNHQNHLNKTKLKTLNSVYKETFAHDDKLPLSWQIAFLNFNKPQLEK